MNEASKPDLDVGDWLTAATVREADYPEKELGPPLPNGMTMRELAKLAEEDDYHGDQEREERPPSPE